MLSACSDCSKGSACCRWALWGCGTAADPHGTSSGMEKAGTPHTEVVNRDPKGKGLQSRKELTSGDRDSGARHGAIYSSNGPASVGCEPALSQNPGWRLWARRAPFRIGALGLWYHPQGQYLSHVGFSRVPVMVGQPSAAPSATRHSPAAPGPPHQPQARAASQSCRQEGVWWHSSSSVPWPQQPARSRRRVLGVCHGTSAPICLSSPLHTPIAAHLCSHMAEEDVP